MKITGVETILVDVSSDGGRPADDTRPAWRDFPTLLVRVDTDEGLSGWGEAYGYGIAPATKVVIDQVLAPQLTGDRPRRHRRHRAPAQPAAALLRTQRYLSFGLSGIDIALWDLAGKVAGQPLHRLLGGAVRQAVEVYASLVGYGDAATVAERAGEAVAAGYRQVKLHERELGHVEAVRAAAGPDVGLMLDVNCAWTVEQALRMAGRLRALDLRWIEDAVWPPEDHGALARLRGAGLRISAGENVATLFDFRHLFELGARRRGPARRHQDRRRHRDAQGGGPGRGVRGDLLAPLRRLRPRVPGIAAGTGLAPRGVGPRAGVRGARRGPAAGVHGH